MIRQKIKKGMIRMLGIGFAAAALLMAGGGSSLAAWEKGPGIPKENWNQGQDAAGGQDGAVQELLNSFEGVADADALIVAAGEPSGGSAAVVQLYTRQEDGLWKKEFSVPGLWGRGGATQDKREGDGKTPLGTYSFTKAFGIRENPGSRLPYQKLTSQDYWVDDPDSRYYNQMVNTGQVKKDWSSAEHLIAVKPHYNYCLALNYNEERVPGKGSAIFLHCMKDENDVGTSGCVKLPEEYMKILVQTVTERTRIVITTHEGQLP